MSTPGSRPKWLTADWWLRDGEGTLILAQAPNPPILVWMATVIIGWTNLVASEDLLSTLGRGALLAWGADELLRGATPFRRVLGFAVCGYAVIATFELA